MLGRMFFYWVGLQAMREFVVNAINPWTQQAFSVFYSAAAQLWSNGGQESSMRGRYSGNILKKLGDSLVKG